MAYMSQDRKKELTPGIKKVLKKYGVKATLSVRNHSVLVLNISAGKLDFLGEYNEEARDGRIQVNPYWVKEHYSGVSRDFLTEVVAAMNAGNWDRSDVMTDYFDVGWYVDINVGKWNKPYVFEG